MAWTVVGVLSGATFAALSLLATALFQLRGEFRTEIRALRTELREDISDLRGELTGMRGDLTGMRGDIRALGDRLTAAGA